MTSPGEEGGRRTDQLLDDMMRDADEYYTSLSKKHVAQTRLDVTVVSLITWFASFVVLGLTAFLLYREVIYIVIAFVLSLAIAGGAGGATYFTRRKRGFKFAELGALVKKMKEGGASSEDGLRLMDAMHQAALVARKRKMDSAFEYGIVAFAIVSLVGLNAGIGALAGVITYLYFRYEALRDFEKEEKRYAESKDDLLQSL